MIAINPCTNVHHYHIIIVIGWQSLLGPATLILGPLLRSSVPFSRNTVNHHQPFSSLFTSTVPARTSDFNIPFFAVTCRIQYHFLFRTVSQVFCFCCSIQNLFVAHPANPRKLTLTPSIQSVSVHVSNPFIKTLLRDFTDLCLISRFTRLQNIFLKQKLAKFYTCLLSTSDPAPLSVYFSQLNF